ncbi:MAG: circularly permuted type 2 ATP-grasp protein [Opitutales bacterium]
MPRRAASSRDHFRDYQPVRDEMWTAPGQPRPDTAALFATLNRFGTAELEARHERLDRATRELGVHHAVVDDQPIDDQEWQLDLLPRLLKADEWAGLERGLIQRARAFNAYIADIYSEQRILRDRVVPYDIVLGDPAFHRQLIGLPIAGSHAPVGAVDLVRDTHGEWQVLENHFSTPFGISYVLQCRRMLAQAFPELFATSDVAPVAPFAAQLAELLRARSPRRDPRIVLLCRGEDHQSYFEESFLGRNLGIPMVQPADLLVRESRVFLKTIRGLEQVDVIYRRIESSSIDPIAFGYSRFQGVPGLVNCVRKGNVAIVNAVGSGVADNRAILRYSDRIITHYLRERPLLKTVPTFTCRDWDQALHVHQNLDQMVLKPIHDLNTMQKYYGTQLDLAGARDLRPILTRHPELLVAQPRLTPSRAPRFQNGHFVSRSVFLRAFVLLSDPPVVLPGGLTRQALGSGDPPRLTIMAGGMKDTWVPAASPGAPAAAAAAAPEAAGEEFSIGSRVAEMLYWMGRYLERAENTARQLNILETVRWDALGREAQRLYWPLWRAVTASTGQVVPLRKTPPKDLASLTRALVLDPELSASAHACVRSAISNAAAIRDIVSPELWQVLNQLGLQLENLGKPASGQSRPRLREISQLVVDECRRAAGVAERTMLHDEAWQFYRVGTRLERAIDTLNILHSLLGPEARAELGRLEQETDLIALLRLLCSLDAYRRSYRSRAYLERVVALMLRNPANPSAVAHCLRQLRLSLANLETHQDFGAAQALLQELDALSEACETLDPARILATGSPDLLGNLRRQVAGLHPHLEDTYFSHQHFYSQKKQTQLELS